MGAPTALTLEATLRNILAQLKVLENRRAIIPNPDPTLGTVSVTESLQVQNSLTLDGLLDVIGSLEVAGPTSLTGATTMTGPLSLTGLFTANGVRQIAAASSASRDAQIPAPNQGDLCWRSDTGWEEQYFGLWNSATNPGGAAVAGWYPVSGKLPRARIFVNSSGISGINLACYCFHGSTYMATPANDYADTLAWDPSTGRFTAPLLGRWGLSARMWMAGSSTQTGLQVGVTVNSTNSVSSPASSAVAQGANGLIGFTEQPTVNGVGSMLVMDRVEWSTSAVTDYFQFWFSASVSAATTSVLAKSSAAALTSNTQSFIDVSYLGPPLVTF